VSDPDPKFTNAFWIFSKKVGMKPKLSTAFHSQMVGKTNGVNGILNQLSRNLVDTYQRDWANYVGRAEFS